MLLEAQGVRYPPNHLSWLIGKYRGVGVKFPRILMRMGDPNIRKHFAYFRILNHPGKLLDYGCGTGDDIRALISDGYPKTLVTGYDVEATSIDVGYDFYVDRPLLESVFRIDPTFPFAHAEFDIVYSGSVIHIFESLDKIKEYLQNMVRVLRSGGIFFGSSLGRLKSQQSESYIPSTSGMERKLYLIDPEDLRAILKELGFYKCKIVPLRQENDQLIRLWFYAKKK